MAEGASALEGTTLHQLLSNDDSQLLDAIDELRSLGIGRLLEGKGLPQIIVCGDQSSGKSSVLEALTRVRFPTKSSTCTTFPTELRLRREQQYRISCRIKAGPTVDAETAERLSEFSQSFDSPEKFADLVAGARKAMSQTSDDKPEFFDNVLEVEIMGPRLVPLTLVDLPGVIHYSNAPSGSRDIELINNLVSKYMAEPNSIILAVVSAHNDLNLQAILTRIQRVNGATDRTLGIITKPDELPPGSEKEQECIEYARSNSAKFKYGWHVVRNRSFGEQNKTLEERDALETEFFKKSSWNSLPIRDVGRGIDSLRQKLSKMLIDHISLSLPSIVDRLDKDLTQSTHDLHKLGDARNTVNEMRNYLFDISDSFSEYTRDALDGRYHRTDFFGEPLEHDGLEKRLRANVRNLNDAFATKMLQQGHKWHVVESSKIFTDTAHPNIILKSEFLKRHVDVLANRERNIELPGLSNPALVGSLFRLQSEPWQRIASEHLEAVWTSVKTFLETLLHHLTNDRTSHLIFSHIIDPILENRRQELKTKLEELLIPHRNHHPHSMDPKFGQTILALRDQRAARSVLEAIHNDLGSEDGVPSVEELMAKISVKDAPTENKYGSLETYEAMETYYESAILTFMNNVASLAIEQCLLSGVPKMLSSATVRSMEDAELQTIAAESEETTQERARLSDRVKTLQKGLGILRVHPGSRMQRPITKPATHVVKLPPSAQAQATNKSSVAARKRPVESVLNTSSTGTTNQKPFFDSLKPQTPLSTETKTAAPSELLQQVSTPATQPTAPAGGLFATPARAKDSNKSNAPSPDIGSIFSQFASNVANTSNASSSETNGGFGKFASANVANTSNAPSPRIGGGFGSVNSHPFGSTSHSTNQAGTSGPFGNSATSHTTSGFGNSANSRAPSGFGNSAASQTTSGLFGSASASNTGGTNNTQPLNSNRAPSTLFGGHTPKGTPTSFTPHFYVPPYGEKEVMDIVTTVPEYRSMSFEELRRDDYALGRKWIVHPNS